MKLKKLLILLVLLTLMPILVSCDLSFDFFTSTTTEIIQMSSLPTAINGTITFEDTDYDDLPVYISPTYSLTNIDEYNNILLETQDFARHANIEVLNTMKNDRNRVEGSSSGSGFIFMEDDEFYYAITNYHVVDPGEFSSTYDIKTYEDDIFNSATLIAYDIDIDLAVLKFQKLSREAVTIINIYERLYYKFNRGELVIAVGNPLDLTNNVTFGEFKGMEEIDNVDYSVIYHDAKIYSGSSGGALVDVDGILLGVNTWGTGESEVYSFAIPNYIVYIFLINYGILD